MTTAGMNNHDGDQTPRVTDSLERIASLLSTGSAAERYRALRFYIGAIARANGMDDGQGAADLEKLENLSKKVRTLEQTIASERDSATKLEANLVQQSEQCKSEQARAGKFEKLADEQRERLSGFQRQVTNLEDQLRVRTEDLSKAQRETEDLTLKLQRLGQQKDQTGEIERLSRELRKQSDEVERLAKESAQLRADKDVEIEQLKATLAQERTQAGAKSTISFADVWKRLVSPKPPLPWLVQGHIQPTQPSAERMADLLVFLARIVDEFDKMMRPFLSKYTAFSTPLRTPWENYAKGPSLLDAIRDLLLPSGGKPVDPRLRALYKWTHAATIASDVTFECIRPELHSFLMGPAGTAAEPNRTIKQFLKGDGHELFLQHMRQVRTANLEKVFAAGVGGEAFGRGS